MSVLFLVLPLALILVAGALIAYVWSIRQGQMDDLDTPALRMLQDDSDAISSVILRDKTERGKKATDGHDNGSDR